jgi:hypothetical protein
LSRDFRRQPIEHALAAMKLVPKGALAAVSPAAVAAMLRDATAMRQGQARNLVDEIQAKIDAAVFPSLAARGAALLAGIAGRLPWRKSR